MKLLPLFIRILTAYIVEGIVVLKRRPNKSFREMKQPNQKPIFSMIRPCLLVAMFSWVSLVFAGDPDCPNAGFNFKDSLVTSDTLKICVNTLITLEDATIIDPAGTGATLDFIDVDWGDLSRDTSLISEDNTHLYFFRYFSVAWMVKNKDIPSPCIDTSIR